MSHSWPREVQPLDWRRADEIGRWWLRCAKCRIVGVFFVRASIRFPDIGNPGPTEALPRSDHCRTSANALLTRRLFGRATAQEAADGPCSSGWAHLPDVAHWEVL